MSDNLYLFPWKLETDDDESFKRGDRLSVVDRFDMEVCELTPFEDIWTVGEILRARLIVAAPELLKSLKETKEAVAAVMRAIDAAIAKAEGRTIPPGRTEQSPTEPQSPSEAKS
jgi:hypothetical protein